MAGHQRGGGLPLEDGAVFGVEIPVGIGFDAEADFLMGVAVVEGFEIGFHGGGVADVAVVVAVAGAGFDDGGDAVGLFEEGEDLFIEVGEGVVVIGFGQAGGGDADEGVGDDHEGGIEGLEFEDIFVGVDAQERWGRCYRW